MKNAFLTINLLDLELIEKVHDASLSILEEMGIMIDSEKVHNILKTKGVESVLIDRKRGKTFWRIKFRKDIIAEALETAPKTITLAGKIPKYDLHLDGKGIKRSVYFGTVGGAPMIHDLETGERRASTLEDLRNCARLVDILEDIDYFHVMLMPSDVPTPVVDLYRWKTSFENISKHSMTAAAYDTRNLPFLIEMAACVSGGEDKLRRRPIFSATECPVAPLYFGERAVENIVDLAKAGLPVIIYSEPFAGASSPVTLAGTLVVTNSEVLAGVAITQIINPGSPVIYGSVSTMMDLRTGNISFGAPETGLFNAATTAMARFYGLPNLTAGGRTDSKVPDCQAGFEKQSNVLLAALSGANLNNMAGLLESCYTASLSQLVMDDEIIKRTKRLLKGFSLDNDKLAVDLIKEVGPGGQYLGNEHTLHHMLDECLVPNISNKGSYEDWKKKGALSLEQVAQLKAKELLRANKSPTLEEEKIKELGKIIQHAEKMHGVK
jgi:trimethylamine--corrinoid protein Co-methyltransferase